MLQILNSVPGILEFNLWNLSDNDLMTVAFTNYDQ